MATTRAVSIVIGSVSYFALPPQSFDAFGPFLGTYPARSASDIRNR
jgi:hypothetical protein